MSSAGRERSVAVVGGGPAGLMAAEAAAAAGCQVDLYEAKASVGRKFLIAGKGGLNLTHSEPLEQFIRRYRERQAAVAGWLAPFDADALRLWASGLGVETFIGSSGRIFPNDMKAAPLLRAWVRRLRESGVRFHVQHRLLGIDAGGTLNFETPDGRVSVQAGATVLALGGGSWPQLGSDGAWVGWLGQLAQIKPLQPSNCGFDHEWSSHFSSRFAGHPVKPAWISVDGPDGAKHRMQGEFVITQAGIEGSLVYALSPLLREAINRNGQVTIELDLAPGRGFERVLAEVSRPRKGRTLSEFLRRNVGLQGVQLGLLHELVARQEGDDPVRLATMIKALPITLVAVRPLPEAISSAGGVALESLTPALMLQTSPGVFCAGEMLDWEAPTGGYLLAASFASGRIAGQAAAEFSRV